MLIHNTLPVAGSLRGGVVVGLRREGFGSR
jgi:hypothetical protein